MAGLAITGDQAGLRRLICVLAQMRSASVSRPWRGKKKSPPIPLPDLLHLVGARCPKMDALGNDPCGAHYRDL